MKSIVNNSLPSPRSRSWTALQCSRRLLCLATSLFLRHIHCLCNGIHDNESKRDQVHPLIYTWRRSMLVRAQQTIKGLYRSKQLMLLILTYLAQNDLSGGFTTSPSPTSPLRISSVKTGALKTYSKIIQQFENNSCIISYSDVSLTFFYIINLLLITNVKIFVKKSTKVINNKYVLSIHAQFPLQSSEQFKCISPWSLLAVLQNCVRVKGPLGRLKRKYKKATIQFYKTNVSFYLNKCLSSIYFANKQTLGGKLNP